MAKTYKRYGEGGRFKRQTLGDPIQEIRFRDQNIIDAIRLERKQHVERSGEYVSGRKRADDVTATVTSELEELETKKFNTRLQAVKIRGQQEGAKGKAKAEEILRNAAPWVNFSKTLATQFGKLSGSLIQKSLAEQAVAEEGKGGEMARGVLANYYEKQLDYSLLTALGTTDGMQNPELVSSILGGEAKLSLNVNQARGYFKTITKDSASLIQRAYVDLISSGQYSNGPKLRNALNGVKNNLIIQAGLEGSSLKERNEFELNWSTKVNALIRVESIKDTVKRSKQNYNVASTNFQNDLTIGNAYLAAKVFQTIPSLSNGKLGRFTTGEALKETIFDTILNKDISQQDIYKLLHENTSLIWDPKHIKPDGKPGDFVPDPSGQTIAQMHPKLWTEYIKKKQAQEDIWKKELTSAQAETERTVLKTELLPIISGQKEYPQDWDKFERELRSTNEISKNGPVSSALSVMKKASFRSWEADQRIKLYEELYEKGDFESLLTIRNALDLNKKEMKVFNSKYLPLLTGLEKYGHNQFNYAQQGEKIFKEHLKWSGVNISLRPLTLDRAIVVRNQLFAKYYKDYSARKDPDAVSKAEQQVQADIIKGENEPSSPFYINPELQKPNQPREFTNLLTKIAADTGDPNYIMPFTTYEQLKEEKGHLTAITHKGALSLSHLTTVLDSVLNGRTFTPADDTYVPGVPIADVYEKAIRNSGNKDLIAKLDSLADGQIPADRIDYLSGIAQKTPEYTKFLERTLQRLKKIYDPNDTMTAIEVALTEGSSNVFSTPAAVGAKRNNSKIVEADPLWMEIQNRIGSEPLKYMISLPVTEHNNNNPDRQIDLASEWKSVPNDWSWGDVFEARGNMGVALRTKDFMGTPWYVRLKLTPIYVDSNNNIVDDPTKGRLVYYNRYQ